MTATKLNTAMWSSLILSAIWSGNGSMLLAGLWLFLGAMAFIGDIVINK